MDYPNLYFEHYRRLLLSGACKTYSGAFAMLSDAYNRGELTQAEVRSLLEMPLDRLTINAPGGRC